MALTKYPRLVVAGLGGDSGKTFITCGILGGLRHRGLKTAAFKKGPDYIDPAWLGIASGSLTRNLDTYLMAKGDILQSFTKNASGSDISVIEGNRGLHDGFDTQGSHSTAELAILLGSPVVLIINATKITRTAAAIALGCKMLDERVNIAGIILNQVSGKRHIGIVSGSIEQYTGIPVIGAIPKLPEPDKLPSRHLGLVTPREHGFAETAVLIAAEAIEKYVSLGKIIEIAGQAPELDIVTEGSFFEKKGKIVKIGYFNDRAFSFYYPENLEALENAGAELCGISSIDGESLEGIDALYIGGGFPETNIEALANNILMKNAVKSAAESGMPIYAECGGLMYLARFVEVNGVDYELAGVFPIKIKMETKPQGHGYSEVEINGQNPYFPVGTAVRGHEFHYSRVSQTAKGLEYCMKVNRGSGIDSGNDGLVYKNTLGCYLHLHTLSCKEWAGRMAANALKYKQDRL